MKRTYCIYRHIRLDTLMPFYIGLGKDLLRPYHFYNRNKEWNKIVEEAGIRVDILFDDLTKLEAEEKERELIALYGRENNGTGILCNKNSGGAGGNMSEWTDERREKTRLASTGRRHTEEAIKSMSAKQKGRRKPDRFREKCLENWAIKKLNGWSMPEETRRKLSESRIGQVHPISVTLKRSKRKEGSNPVSPLLRAESNSKYWVYRLDPITNEVLDKHNGVSSASRIFNINPKNLQSVVDGKRRIAGGFAWRKELKNG